MKQSMSPMVVAILLAGFCGGCYSRIAKEAIGGVRGGKGSFTVLRDIAGEATSESLGAYRRFQIEQFTDDMGGRTPTGVLTALPGHFQTELANIKIANAASGKTLLIRGKVVHYEAASLSGELFGPLEEVVAKVQFVDADTRNVIAEANCVGRTNSTSSRGVATKAQGLAKAIVGYIDKRYPEDLRICD